jgi:hypothetical protein
VCRSSRLLRLLVEAALVAALFVGLALGRCVRVRCVAVGWCVFSKETAYLTAKTPNIFRLARRARAPAAPDRGAPAARTEMCFSL